MIAGRASALEIDWVLVGDPGNAADTPSTNCFSANCGSVRYEYYISTYEVTNAQYAEFLNAKAAEDPTGTDAQPVCSAPTATPNRANFAYGVVGSVTDVGAYPASPGAYGTSDQGGNVLERVEDYLTYPAWPDAWVTPRGGAWTYGADYLSREIDPNAPSEFETESIGFRVASLVPEPGASARADRAGGRSRRCASARQLPGGRFTTPPHGSIQPSAAPGSGRLA